MTWLELRDWAYREDQRLRAAGFWDGIDWPPKHLIGLWLKRRDAVVTQSVEHFLETGEWGELPRDDRAGLYYRIAWATQLLALLTHPTFGDITIIPEPTADASAIRRWVLIEMWEIFGRSTVANYSRWRLQKAQPTTD
jgi:hypothetical protein